MGDVAARSRLTRVEIREYYLDRLTNAGPFADWPRTVGARTPQFEITFLSALYTFLGTRSTTRATDP